MRIMPNMSLSSSAQVLADKQSMLQKNRDVHNAIHLNATSLWSASLTSTELTKYAEGLVAQNFDCRLSLILIPRLRPCSGRLKGKAMICLLTVSIRIKARAETDSGRFTKHYVYTVLSRVYNFYKS